MPGLAILFGTVLAAVGLGFYFALEAATALIPAYFGVALIVLGLIASAAAGARKHAMHLAALVGLLGVLGGFGMGVPGLMKHFNGVEVRFYAVVEQLVLGVVSLVFLVMCVRSFIAARRARQAS